jgi:protein-S-isoprenylcysteine O-methyltransferase Ste14
MVAITRIAYRFRGFLISPPYIFALICFKFETELDWLIWPLGVSIFILGLLLRIWAQQHLHYRLRVKKHLVTTGPYSFMRNPVYLGNLLICLGSVVTSELLWLVPIALFYCFGIYSLAVRYEEGHLTEKYGESYRKYMLEVPRWFPRTIRFETLRIKNEYIRPAILAEIHCIFALLPFLIKEMISGIIYQFI